MFRYRVLQSIWTMMGLMRLAFGAALRGACIPFVHYTYTHYICIWWAAIFLLMDVGHGTAGYMYSLEPL